MSSDNQEVKDIYTGKPGRDLMVRALIIPLILIGLGIAAFFNDDNTLGFLYLWIAAIFSVVIIYAILAINEVEDNLNSHRNYQYRQHLREYQLTLEHESGVYRLLDDQFQKIAELENQILELKGTTNAGTGNQGG